MLNIHHSDARGKADHGWLQSRHSFSFASYYDPANMGVSALRVINDDRVKPGQGFSTHSHQDMEIISYVKKGSIEHRDSMGHIKRLPAGEFQLMTAGSGVTHSEYNPSSTESLEFLQIWIQPDVVGIEPGYQQKRFATQSGLQLIASPHAENGSLLIHQDARLFQLRLDSTQSVSLAVTASRHYYLHMVSGTLQLNDETLSEGDGCSLTQLEHIHFKGISACEALFFDLP